MSVPMVPPTSRLAVVDDRVPGLASAGPRSLAEKAYQELVRMITRLQLAPGSVLAEKALVEHLGIGRTPIREALQRLAIEGLVTHQPNRGMFVAEIGAASVQEIYEFRTLIDGGAARLAAARATVAQIDVLDALQASLVRATADDDIDRYVELDRRFYDALAEAAHNALLAEVVPRIFNLHLRLWFFISKKIGSWHPIAEAHEVMTRAVVEALRRRDADAAELAMRVYISRRHQDIREVL
jgi:DNA-binding GntR family transcriptional regulator